MKSTVSTALKAITSEYLLSSPTTPTDLIGKKTANAWLTESYKLAFLSSSIKIKSAS